MIFQLWTLIVYIFLPKLSFFRFFLPPQKGTSGQRLFRSGEDNPVKPTLPSQPTLLTQPTNHTIQINHTNQPNKPNPTNPTQQSPPQPTQRSPQSNQTLQTILSNQTQSSTIKPTMIFIQYYVIIQK